MQCSECGFTGTAAQLRTHKESVHDSICTVEETVVKRVEGRFHCFEEGCESSYATGKSLARHHKVCKTKGKGKRSRPSLDDSEQPPNQRPFQQAAMDSDDDQDLPASEPALVDEGCHLLYLPQLVDARLGVDPIHHCIVCVECAYALPLSNILRHFKDKHSPALLPNNFAQILEQNGVPERAVKPSKAVAPIDGINVVQGWCCAQPGCNAAYTEKGTLRRMHLDPVHQGQRDFATCCSVQVVYKQPNIETWQVNYLLGAAAPSNNVHVQDYMQDYLRRKHAEEATISAIQPPLDDRQLSPFFQRYPWLHMSKGLKPQAMQELVALPGTKDTLMPLRQHVNQYFEGIRPLIRRYSVDRLLLRMVNSPKAK